MTNNIYDMRIEFDLFGKITGLNKSAEKTYNWKKNELVGEYYTELLPIEEKESFTKRLKRQEFKSSQGFSVSHRVKKNNEIFSVFVNFSQIRDDKDVLIGFSSMEIVLPDQVIAQIQSKNFLHQAPDAIVIINDSGEIAFINVQAEKLFGFKNAKLLGKDVELLISEKNKNRENFQKKVQQVVEKKKISREVEIIAKKKNGTHFLAEINLAAVPLNHKIFVIAIVRDISLKNQLQKHGQALIEHAVDCVIGFDSTYNIFLSNPSSHKMFEYKQLLGKSLKSLVSHDQSHESVPFIHALQELRRIKPPGIIGEINLKRSPRQTFWAEMSISPVEENGGVHYVAVIRDVTKKVKHDQQKSEFISTLSHEIRTPLASINGAIKLILGGKCGEISEKEDKFLTIALRNAEHLNQLVNDILDIEKIEAGKIDFHFENVELATLIKKVIDNNRLSAEEKEITLELDEPNKPVYVFVDPTRLMQAFTNLLSNAIKFSPNHSKVVVKVERKRRTVKISVIDQGIGIPSNFKDQIFHRFSQVTPEKLKKRGTEKIGTGLGLSITKAVIEQLNGKIGYESEEGKGSTFFIELEENRIKAGTKK
ncbi:MAG: PAS domain S-box protein [Waddliaceae bacterium]